MVECSAQSEWGKIRKEREGDPYRLLPYPFVVIPAHIFLRHPSNLNAWGIISLVTRSLLRIMSATLGSMLVQSKDTSSGILLPV